MAGDLPVRQPGSGLPTAVRDAAARAGRRRRPPVDPLALQRVRDALARLPDSAAGRRYIAAAGDCLAVPRQPQEEGHAVGGPGQLMRDHRTGGRSWDS
jgi:hypothetical protein